MLALAQRGQDDESSEWWFPRRAPLLPCTTMSYSSCVHTAVGNAPSRPIREAKQRSDRAVLRWGTTWEVRLMQGSLFAVCASFLVSLFVFSVLCCDVLLGRKKELSFPSYARFQSLARRCDGEDAHLTFSVSVVTSKSQTLGQVFC